MKNPKEIVIRTVYDLAKDIDNGFLCEALDIFEKYKDKNSKNIALNADSLKYLMQDILEQWLNLNIYSREDIKNFELNINWVEFNKLISLNTEFLTRTVNANNNFDIYSETLRDHILTQPNAVVITLTEY